MEIYNKQHVPFCSVGFERQGTCSNPVIPSLSTEDFGNFFIGYFHITLDCKNNIPSTEN